jgi:hypothetical protein
MKIVLRMLVCMVETVSSRVGKSHMHLEKGEEDV